MATDSMTISICELIEEHETHVRILRRFIDGSRKLLTERDAAREELAKLKAAQPESAPVAGGVTEDMLDSLLSTAEAWCNQQGFAKVREWINRARAAIRAQKRVDVEAIREVAALVAYLYDDPELKRRLLRAIGDEPAEAPVNSPGIQDGSIAETPVAEPAAPAQEQEGPFSFDYGGRGPYMYIRRDGKEDVVLTNLRMTTGEELAALLNAGLEAPKLRARVAELEKERERFITSINARQEQVVAAATELGEMFRKAVDAEARADDAEAKLAALGENPIPRALVERHLAKWSRFGAGDVLEDILVGREPGVAS